MIESIIFIAALLVTILILSALPRYKVDHLELGKGDEITVHYIPTKIGEQFYQEPFTRTMVHTDYTYVFGDCGWVWHDKETGMPIGRELGQELGLDAFLLKCQWNKS